MNPEFAAWSDLALSALGNGVVQGLVVLLVVWAARPLLRRTNASTRYAVQFASLAIVAMLPVLHLLLGAGAGPTVVEAAESEVRGEPVSVEAQPAPAESEMFRDVSSTDPMTAGAGSGTEAARPLVSMAVEPGSDAAVAAAGETDARAGWRRWLAVESRWQLAVPRVAVLGWWLAWGATAVIGLGRLLLQYVALAGRKRASRPASAEVTALFHSLREDMRVTRPAEVRLSTGLSSPIAAGFARPMVLIPEALEAAEDVDWERLLRHELAHLGRRDDWTNLIQQVIRAVLFFHPAVWWLSRRLTIDREIACDDHVLSATGSPRAYALFLTEFARRARGPEWVAAPAAWSNPSQLTERIDMLLDTKRNASPRLVPLRAGAWTSAVLLIAVLGLYAAPRLALAGADGTVAGTENLESALAAAPAAPEAPAAAEAPEPPEPPEPAPAAVAAPAPLPAPAPLTATPPVPPLPPAPALSLVGPEEREVVLVTGTPTVASAGHGLVVSSRAVAGTHPKTVVRSRTHPGGSALVVASAGDAYAGPATTTAAGTPAPAETTEQRLARLEKLVAELQRRGAKPSPGWSVNTDVATRIDGKPDGRVLMNPAPEFHFDGLAKILADVNQTVAQAAKDAEKAVRDAEKSSRLSAEAGKPEKDAEGDLDRQARRKALEAQRRALQKQISSLEGQLGRLEGQLDRLGESVERREERMVEDLARDQARVERQKARARQLRDEAEHRRIERESARPADAPPAAGDKDKEGEGRVKTKDHSGDNAPALKP